LIASFLRQFHVDHELVQPDSMKHTIHLGSDPAVEVDGRMFVDPNVDALKKILRVK
jgi:hypothetical protein